MPRLDLILVEKGIVKSRERAKEHIKSGNVLVNEKAVQKPSAEVSYSDEIVFLGSAPKYVGRGGLKLEKAVQSFEIKLDGFICADLGASTGGFTDCMLKFGAKKVYAVDVGHDQLDESLKENPAVVNIEGVNVKDVSSEIIPEPCDFAAADLSFISVKYAAEAAHRILKPNGKAVFLIKPQFEAGKANISKGGIVKSQKVHTEVLRSVADSLCKMGFDVKGLIPSPIKGGDGNIEYLAYAVKSNTFTAFTADFKAIAVNAFNGFGKEKT